MFLFLSDRTVILKGPEDIQVLRGDSALLDCHFYKDPGLHKYEVIWKKDGSQIQDDK